MDRTRRSLMKAGLVSLSAAALAPRLLAGDARSVEHASADNLLAQLVSDTKRNCRLAQVPGRRQAAAFRALATDVDMATAYVLARRSSEELKAAFATVDVTRLSNAGWSRLQSDVQRDYGVTIQRPGAALYAIAAEGCRLFGYPSTTKVRYAFEACADQIELSADPFGGDIQPQQVPGSDFGSWAIGTGNPGWGFNCRDIAVLMALLQMLCSLYPELAAGYELIVGCLGGVAAFACTQP